jgi:MoxR-like ATPase
LLEVLSDFQVSVPELGTLTAKHQPMVILTSNNTRELSEALKRRCLYLFIDYPNHEEELRIVRMRVPELEGKLAQQAVEVVQQLRQMDLKKHPSVAETIDWAKALVMLNADSLDQKTLENTLTVLLKHEADAQRAKRALGSDSSRRSGGGADRGLSSGSQRPTVPPNPFSGIGGGRGRRN